MRGAQRHCWSRAVRTVRARLAVSQALLSERGAREVEEAEALVLESEGQAQLPGKAGAGGLECAADTSTRGRYVDEAQKRRRCPVGVIVAILFQKSSPRGSRLAKIRW